MVHIALKNIGGTEFVGFFFVISRCQKWLQNDSKIAHAETFAFALIIGIYFGNVEAAELIRVYV